VGVVGWFGVGIVLDCCIGSIVEDWVDVGLFLDNCYVVFCCLWFDGIVWVLVFGKVDCGY